MGRWGHGTPQATGVLAECEACDASWTPVLARVCGIVMQVPAAVPMQRRYRLATQCLPEMNSAYPR